jgi:beta-N-acetylhexosaminidase
MKKILALLMTVIMLIVPNIQIFGYFAENLSELKNSRQDYNGDGKFNVLDIAIFKYEFLHNLQSTEPTADEKALKNKIAGLFVVRPETLTGGELTSFTEEAAENLQKYPVGGVIFFKKNITGFDQTTEFISAFEAANVSGEKLWFGVDMEGGIVNRFPKEYFLDMQVSAFDMAQQNTPEQVGEIYYNLGLGLKEWGFNVDFAPVVDIFSNPENTVIGHRSFGTDPETVSKYSSAAAFGLQNSGVMPVLKHFPGHGNVAGDTHYNFVVEYKDAAELRAFELVPFNNIVSDKSYIGGVMTAHIACPNVTGNDLPATLSPEIITDMLRGEMDFDGVVFTDALEMGAIINEYGAGEAAVLSILAGTDVLLLPPDLEEAINAVYDAVIDGTISEERIDESLQRIAKAKATFA